MSRLLACIAALAVVATTYLAGPAGASTTDRGTSVGVPLDRHGEGVLSRAAQVLTGASGGTPSVTQDAGRVDATIALRDLFLARPDLDDASDAREAQHLLARPTDGPHDSYGDGYTVPATKKCSTHFCIHWVTRSSDAATTAWVDTTLQTMEQVWHHHVGVLGYRPPPTDGKRGGNAKFDVYLKELGSQGLYGYCAPERRVPGRPHAASGFCVLDNDFARSQFHRAPIQALQVTAAHEFFHAIQFGYDFQEDPWLLESTATWMEERFADSVNDNRMYLPYGQVGIPSAPLDTFDGSGFNQYGNWAFFEYLSEHFGDSVVRKIFQHLGNGKSAGAYSIQGVRQVLSKHGGLTNVFAAYAGGNTLPGRTYEEGSAFPATQIAASRDVSASSPRWTYATQINHLSAKDVRLVPASSLGAGWQLRLRVNAPANATSPAAYLVVRKGHGKVVRRPIALNKAGFGSTTLSFDPATTKSATVSLANVSTRYQCNQGTTFSCAGTPRDDQQHFELNSLAFRP